MGFFKKQLGPFYIFLGSLAVVALLIVIWLVGRSVLSKQGNNGPLIADMLLPKGARPEHYDFTFKVFLPGYDSVISSDRNLTFDAKLVIHLVTEVPLTVITVNSRELEFKLAKCKFVTETGESIRITKLSTDEDLEKTEFHLEKAAPAGRYNITIVFNGTISDQLVGFYRTTYNNRDGVQRIAAVTKFEPFYARKLVPCLDEPIYKASWSVTVIHPKGTTAITNSIELDDQEEEADFLVTKFKKTPLMSSYLLAVFISDYAFIEGRTQSGCRVRVWTRPEAKSGAEFALQTGIQSLEAYEKLYGIPFPLEKQDLVALPDFVSGAMENWGMVTFKESLVLYDKKNYYYTNKIRVMTIIAHEMSHQWFGNLVTMKFWEDVWLNEGFAAFQQNIGADLVSNGELKQEEEFVTSGLQQSLELDGTAASHPIIYPITNREEITDLFDPISYRKGAAFLAMVRKLMGEENYKLGIQKYLKKYSYSNTDHFDLFTELDTALPSTVLGPDGRRLNITEFADRWTQQMGYPYLTLVSHNETHYSVTQDRYKVDPNAEERAKFSSTPFGYKWDVPVWFQRGKNVIELDWLPADGNLFLEKGEDPLLVINADSYAIARINYEESGWQKIFEQLELDSTVFSPRTKYRILSDVFAMAAIDNVSYSLALNSTKYLVSEKDFLAWEAVSHQIDILYENFGSLPQREAVSTFVRKLIEPRFYDIDIRYTTRSMDDNEGYMSGRLDVLLWNMYCKADPGSCSQTVNLYFKGMLDACKRKHSILSQCGRIHPGIRNYVYNEAVRGSVDHHQTMLKFYERETLQLERERLLEALSSSSDKKFIKSLMSNITTPGVTLFRNQDCNIVAQYLSINPAAMELLLPHLIENWADLRRKFSEAPSHLNKMISFFTAGIHTQGDLDMLKQFADSTSSTVRYFSFTLHIQKAQKRLDWLKRNAANLEKLLPNVFG